MLIEEYKPQSAQDKCTRYIRSFKRPSRRYNGSTFKSRIRWTFRLYFNIKSTIPLTEEDKEKIKEEKIKRKKEEELEKEEQKRQEGIWKTSWQWLKEDNRKIVENSVPEERYNWIYDEASDSFEEASKAFYYYSQ